MKTAASFLLKCHPESQKSLYRALPKEILASDPLSDQFLAATLLTRRVSLLGRLLKVQKISLHRTDPLLTHF